MQKHIAFKRNFVLIYSNEYSKPQFYSLFEPFSSPIRPHNGIYFVTIEFFCGIQQCWQININFNIMEYFECVLAYCTHVHDIGRIYANQESLFQLHQLWYVIHIIISNTAFQWTLKYSMWCKNKGKEYAFGWLKSSNYFEDSALLNVLLDFLFRSHSPH